MLYGAEVAYHWWPRFSPDPRRLVQQAASEVTYSSIPVLFGVVFFSLSMVSTLHRGLTQWDGGRTKRLRALLRLAVVLAMADVVLWTAGVLAGSTVGMRLGLYTVGTKLGWGAAWLATRLALGAPEPCILERDCGWRAAIRRSRPRGPTARSLLIAHVVTLSAALFIPGSGSLHTLLPLIVIQTAVSFDAAASAAWYRLTCREPAVDDLARVFE
ncbi:MAG: hypothetical protein U0234_02275 [Sandaracinus sp.]